AGRLCAGVGLLVRSRVAICLHSPFKGLRSCGALPPLLRLYAVGQASGPPQVRRPAHKAPEPIRPVRISKEGAEHRPAEELSTGADLRRDRELAQQTVVLAALAAGMIEPRLHRQREVFIEKDLRARAER